MSNFVDKRIGFHSASRLPLHSQQALAAAMNVDGHVVTDSQIWTAKQSEFPVNRDLTDEGKANFKTSTDVVGATNDLMYVFTDGHCEDSNSSSTSEYVDNNGNKIKYNIFKGGKIWTNEKYPAVELYQNVEMDVISGSNGAESGGKYQAYHVTESDDANAKRIVDWVPPTAVIDNVTGSPVAGYTGKAEVSTDGKTWSCLQDCSNNNYAWKLSNENWEFVFMAGMLRFNPTCTPTSSGFGYNRVRWTGFKYVGSRLSDDMAKINDNAIYWTILTEEENATGA